MLPPVLGEQLLPPWLILNGRPERLKKTAERSDVNICEEWSYAKGDSLT
jgi:hypothetical protein